MEVKDTARLRRTDSTSSQKSTTSQKSNTSTLSGLKSPTHSLRFPISSVVQRQNKFKLADASDFWKSLNDPEVLLYFASQCVKQLLDSNVSDPTQTSPEETPNLKSTMEQRQELYFEECLLHTLHFLDVFYNISSAEHEREELHQLASGYEQQSTTFRGLYRRLQRSNDSVRSIICSRIQSFRSIDLLLMHYIEECCTVYKNNAVSTDINSISSSRPKSSSFIRATLSNISTNSSRSFSSNASFSSNFPSNSNTTIRGGSSSEFSPYYYLYLKQILRSRICLDTVFAELISNLESVVHMVQDSPEACKFRIVSSLKLVEAALQFTPCRDNTFINSAINALQPLSMWPLDLGVDIQHYLSILEQELKQPGHYARQLFLEYDTSEFQSQAVVAPITVFISMDGPQYETNFHMLSSWVPLTSAHDIAAVNPENSLEDAKLVGRPFNHSGVQAIESALDPITRQIEFIMSLLTSCFPLNNAYQDIEWQLRSAEPDFIHSLFINACQIHHMSIASSGEWKAAIQTFMKSFLSSTRVEALTHKSNQDEDMEESDDCAYSNGLCSILHNDVLLLRPRFVSQLRAKYTLQHQFHDPTGTALYYIYGQEDLEQLRQLVESPSKYGTKVGIIGDTLTTHRILTAFIALYHQHRSLHATLMGQTHFYIVPDGYNAICSYLAQQDPWYHRQVYAPFVVPPAILPRTQKALVCNNSTTTMASFSTYDSIAHPPLPTLPQHCQRSFMQDYVLNAARHSNFCVFECQAWQPNIKRVNPTLPPDINDPADVILPFCVRADIGLLAQGANHAGKAETLSQIVQQKSFQFAALPEMELSYQRVVGPDKLRQHLVTDAHTSWLNLTMASFPSKALGVRNGVLGTPEEPFLELETQRLDAFCVRKCKERPKACAALQRTLEGKGEVESLPLKVQRIEVCCKDWEESFLILLDGEVFGPFRKIHITPVLDRNADYIYFPVRHFTS